MPADPISPSTNSGERVTLQQTIPTPVCDEFPYEDVCSSIPLVAGDSFTKIYGHSLEHNTPYAVAFDVTSQEESYKLDIALTATIDEIDTSSCSIVSLHNTNPFTASALATLALAGTLISRRRRK